MEQAWFFDRLREFADREAFVLATGGVRYRDLLAVAAAWRARLSARGVRAGDVVAVVADFSPESSAVLLALAELGAVSVPLRPSTVTEEKLALAHASLVIGLDQGSGDDTPIATRDPAGTHPLLEQLRALAHPGILLFTSGSTGVPKALLLDFVTFVERFRQPRSALRTLTLLMFDHIGGISTLFGILGYGGTAVVPETFGDAGGKRSLDPDVVCAAVERHKVELLPGSPTFLRMLLMIDAGARYDLSSLKVITYGTEPMYPATLRELCKAFPEVTLKQTYGSSETGILQTRSVARDSLWMTIGGPNVELKVVSGKLFVKARSAMLGYLNAKSPFDDEGFYDTGDLVEQDGDRFLIRGRASDIINVGGEKVFPAEVEAVLLQAPNVRDVTVFGRKSPVTGSVVAARVSTYDDEDEDDLGERLGKFCEGRLDAYKIPVLFALSQSLESVNGKKRRTDTAR